MLKRVYLQAPLEGLNDLLVRVWKNNVNSFVTSANLSPCNQLLGKLVTELERVMPAFMAARKANQPAPLTSSASFANFLALFSSVIPGLSKRPENGSSIVSPLPPPPAASPKQP